MLVMLCSLNVPVTQQLLLEGAAGISPNLMQVCSSSAVVSHKTSFIPASKDRVTSSSSPVSLQHERAADSL